MSSTFVSIDSRDRDRAAWPSASDYMVRVKDDVRDVCAVKIRSCDVPEMWSIPIGRTLLWVDIGSGFRAVEMRAGPHTAATAAPALKTALDVAFGAAVVWQVTADPLGRFKIGGNQSFTVRGGDGESADGYGPKSAGRALGFAPGEQPSDGANEVEAPHISILDRPDTMYLHVEDFDAVRGTGDGGAHNSLDVINSCGTDHDRPAIKEFHPPLSRVSKLRIKIVDYFGEVIDFDNRENRLDLEFVTTHSTRREGPGYLPFFTAGM